MSSRALALLLLSAFGASAQNVNPSLYEMENGQIGPAGVLYRDDIYNGSGDSKKDRSTLTGGLGQLTDGATGCSDDPVKDCGSGAGFEWVAWHDVDPSITFRFDRRCDFKNIRIFAANRPEAGLRLWKTATISLSDDGLNFRDFAVRPTASADEANHKARYIDVIVNGSAKVVRVRLTRADPNSWLAISEVQFEGKRSTDQAPAEKPR